MLLRLRPSGFIEPCLPSPAERPPSGSDWVHEIKHDGYRLMARLDPIGIRLLTRNGHDWSPRYPLIGEAVNRLKVRSCLIDGEAVACDANGLAVFEHLRRKPTGRHVLLYAFDLLELDGEDLRREPFATRKATLASLLRGCLPGLRLNQHLAYPGDVVFQHACKMGLEGIVATSGLRLTCLPRARTISPMAQSLVGLCADATTGGDQELSRRDTRSAKSARSSKSSTRESARPNGLPVLLLGRREKSGVEQRTRPSDFIDVDQHGN